ncbi:MAG: prepilin-type N-terminal cleavage/methylation domain-containing protein [Patescibacteria group bacterium]|mgnify:CR=1 FL=1
MSLYFKNSYGFTLIELLVSIGIISIILTVVVLNQSTYNDSAALTNLADEISSTISQAQAYGVGVKGLSGGFNASYGIVFNLSSGLNTTYLNFADLNGDKIYNGNWPCNISECLSTVNITRGNFIKEICIVRSNNTEQCNVAQRTDISFARPNTEAQIKFFNSGGNQVGASNDKGARIRLQSPRGFIRSVTVYTTGQISVQ